MTQGRKHYFNKGEIAEEISGRAKEKGCLSQDGPTVYNVMCMERVKKQTV